jgi:hypothetical protein
MEGAESRRTVQTSGVRRLLSGDPKNLILFSLIEAFPAKSSGNVAARLSPDAFAVNILVVIVATHAIIRALEPEDVPNATYITRRKSKWQPSQD